MREGKAVKVQLHGIDCPEKKQPYGTKAKRFTSDMAFGKEITVRIQTTDKKRGTCCLFAESPFSFRPSWPYFATPGAALFMP